MEGCVLFRENSANRIYQCIQNMYLKQQLRLSWYNPLTETLFFLTCRRKLKSDIATTFPSLSADELTALVPNKEELNVVKIYAHKGDAVTLYVLQKNPLFFELENRLYPTGEKQAFKLH